MTSSYTNNALERVLRSFKENLVDFISDPKEQYHITQEVYTEAKGCLAAIETLKMDHLFTSAPSKAYPNGNLMSNNYHNTYTNPKYKGDPQVTLAIIQQGEVMLNELKMQLTKYRVQTLQDNELRKLNTISAERFRAFIRNLHPYAFGAYTRMDNYAVNLGINDRYTTIRDELTTRASKQDPHLTHTSWNDRTLPNVPDYKTPDWRKHTYGLRHDDTPEVRRYENKASCTNRAQLGSYFNKDEVAVNQMLYANPLYNNLPQISRNQSIRVNATAAEAASESLSRAGSGRNSARPSRNSAGSCRASSGLSNRNGMFAPLGDHAGEETWRKHAREAGINLNYPGTTEQRSQYKTPVKETYRNFVINPQLDMDKLGRKFTGPTAYTKSSEYQSRYKHPNAQQIDKFPWLAKKW